MSKQKLTKAEIIENIHESSGVKRSDVRVVIDSLFDELRGALGEDRIIELRGFGTFEVRTRKGREKARNPKTGEIVPVESHGVAVFRPGKCLKGIAWSLRK